MPAPQVCVLRARAGSRLITAAWSRCTMRLRSTSARPGAAQATDPLSGVWFSEHGAPIAGFPTVRRLRRSDERVSRSAARLCRARAWMPRSQAARRRHALEDDPIVSSDRPPIAPTVAVRVRCGAPLRWTATVGKHARTLRWSGTSPGLALPVPPALLDPIGSTTEPLPAPTVIDASPAA